MTSFISADGFTLDSLRNDFKKSTLASLKLDLLAGLQVALLALPQAMAYSVIADLPLSAGLFAAIFSCLIATLFSSSRYLVTGPVNTIAILIQASVAEIIFTSFRDIPPSDRTYLAVGLTVQIAFLIGIFQILIGFFRLGKLTQFVSNSVVLGYLSGSLIAVVVNQFYIFLGLNNDPDSHSLFSKTVDIVSRLTEINTMTSLVGIFSLVSIFLLKRISPKMPAGIITLVIATLSLYFFNDTIKSEYFSGVELVGASSEKTSLIPTLYFPFINLNLINYLIPVSFAIALLAILETTCVAKTVQAKTGERIVINQEIISVGLGSLCSSFVGALPISVSPIRSGLNIDSGATSRFAGIFNVMFVAIFVTLFAFFVNLIPLACLSALIMITAFGLIDVNRMVICLKATKADRLVLITTFLSCLFFSLDVAFYIGVALSITSYLRKAAVPQVQEFTLDETGELKAINPYQANQTKPIRVIKVEGELFFAATEVFENALKAITEEDSETKVIILQFKNARDIDATASMTLIDLKESLEKKGCSLLIAGLTMPVWEVLSFSGAVEKIGKQNIFLFEEEDPHRYVLRALDRAHKLAAS